MIFLHLEATKLISEVALIGLKNLRPLVVRDRSTSVNYKAFRKGMLVVTLEQFNQTKDKFWV